MLRYFYILCLLICIQTAFCYDYSEPNSYFAIDRKRKIDRNRGRNQRERSRGRRIEFEVNGEAGPVEQIDVASFIQQVDENVIDDAYGYPNKISNGAKDYGDYENLAESNYDENSKKKDKSQDYFGLQTEKGLKLKANAALFKESINPKYYSSDGLAQAESHNVKKIQSRDDTAVQNDLIMSKKFQRNPEKKGKFKQIKFPFFSRKISETSKPKKGKKRKPFNFAKSKKEEQPNNKMEAYDPNECNANIDYKIRSPADIASYNTIINKRSYQELLCPECKRKFISYKKSFDESLDRRHANNKIIHNSRQFYQDVSDIATNKAKQTITNENETINEAVEDLKPNDNKIQNNLRQQRKRKKRHRKITDNSLEDKHRLQNLKEQVDENVDEEHDVDRSELEINKQLDEANAKRNKRRRRKKREKVTDKERQMQELEEVQRKIDNLDIAASDANKGQKDSSPDFSNTFN